MASERIYEYVVNFKATCGNTRVAVVPSEEFQMELSNFIRDRNVPITDKIASFAILRMMPLSYYESEENGIFYMPRTREVLSKKNLREVRHNLKRGYGEFYQYNSEGNIETVQICKSGRIVINPFRNKNKPFRVTSEGLMRFYPIEVE